MSNRLHNSEKVTYASSFTLQDIADELGIAKSSVSRALSGSGRISEETRQRVLACAERHHYKPNLIAKGLATSRSFNLGVLLPGDSDYSDIPFFHKCLAGITQEADEKGYDVLALISRGNSTEHLERVLSQNKADGIIITRLMENDTRVELLEERGLPYTVIGSTHNDGIVQVDTDNGDACRRFTAKLASSGIRSFLLIGGPSDITVNQSRLSGFKKAMADCSINEADWSAAMENQTLHDVEETLDAFFGDGSAFRPECIIAGDDMLCSYVMTYLGRKELSVPDDVKVASFYNSSLLEKYGSISAIDVNAPLLGKQAALLLLRMLSGEDVEERNSVEYGMLFKDSTAVTTDR